MSLTKKDRKLRSKSGESVPREAPDSRSNRVITTATFNADMSALLKRCYGGRHSNLKVVARAIGANERAVKNWLEGRNAPSAENLLKLVIHSDGMLAGFLAMAGKQPLAISIELDHVASSIETALNEIRKFRSG